MAIVSSYREVSGSILKGAKLASDTAYGPSRIWACQSVPRQGERMRLKISPHDPYGMGHSCAATGRLIGGDHASVSETVNLLIVRIGG